MPDTPSATPPDPLERVLALAAGHGLALRPDTAVPDETGWDFLVVRARADDGTDWILRVPRREDARALAAAEGRLLAWLRGRLPVAVPDWEVDAPGLIAYRRLPGEPAAAEDTTTGELRWRLDRTCPPQPYVDRLGQFMARLHTLPVRGPAGTGIPVRDPAGARERLARHLDFGVAELGMHPAWRERGERWLGEDRLWAGRTVLVHADLHPGHTLVDPSGALTGVLDFADAEIGDPAQEFVEPVRKFPPPMLDRLLEAYRRHDGPVWPGLRAHVVEAIAFAPLTMAVYGVEVDRPRYVQRGREYFAGPPA
jgi:macrolide phosphotransferase